MDWLHGSAESLLTITNLMIGTSFPSAPIFEIFIVCTLLAKYSSEAQEPVDGLDVLCAQCLVCVRAFDKLREAEEVLTQINQLAVNIALSKRSKGHS